MTTGGSSRGPDADLATMLAEMDNRLQKLQRELEEVAVPISRRGVQSPGTGRPVLDPAGSSSAQVEQELGELQTPAPPPEPPAAPAAPRATRPVVRPPRAAAGPPATSAPPAAAVPPAAQPQPPAPAPAATPPAARPRSRRITAVPGERPAGGPPAGLRGVPAPAARAPRANPEPATANLPPAPDALVRETILEAEEEARRIVEDARDRIAAIGARTRALLEQSLTAPAQPAAPAAQPAATPGRRPIAPAMTSQAAEERAYEGAVTLEAGPFGDVVQLKEFEDALASIPGIEDVYIRTFERYYAHFEVRIAAPTRLIAELRTRTSDPLRVIDATGHDPRLEIVRDGRGS